MIFWLLYTPNIGQVIEWFQTEEEVNQRAKDLAIVSPRIRQVDFSQANQGLAGDLEDAQAELRTAKKEIDSLEFKLACEKDALDKLFRSVFHVLEEMEFEDLMEKYR